MLQLYSWRMDQRKKIGARLNAARKTAKLTLEQVASRFDVTAQAVQQWEKGITLPDPVRLNEVATMYNCTIGC